MPVHDVQSSEEFRTLVASAGLKLVVVDFYANWCGPCRQIAPVYEGLSLQYPNALFLKVNVDTVEDVAHSFSVSAMPTFIFLKSGTKVGQVRGANEQALQSLIQQHADTGGAAGTAATATSGGAVAVGAAGEAAEKPSELLPGLLAGHVDLTDLVDEKKSECLNEADGHLFTSALHAGGGFLQSECDEQLIIFITFLQAVKIHTIQVQSPDNGHAPKTLRVFMNQPHAMDFDSADSDKATQEFVLKPGDTTGNGLVPLQFTKFQNVQTITIFIKDNQGDEETTIIDHLAFFGVPAANIDMKDFKRVSGKAGEVHGH